MYNITAKMSYNTIYENHKRFLFLFFSKVKKIEKLF